MTSIKVPIKVSLCFSLYFLSVTQMCLLSLQASLQLQDLFFMTIQPVRFSSSSLDCEPNRKKIWLMTARHRFPKSPSSPRVPPLKTWLRRGHTATS